MKTILLAAGLGTRLLPLTAALPKCLMPIHGRPLLEYWLRSLDKAGVSDVLVNTHHLPQIVSDWLSASPWAGRVRLVHEPVLLGTGGTLLANQSFAGDGPVMLVHADNLCDTDLDGFFAAHQSRTPGTIMTMMSFTTDAPSTCGILELDDQGVVQKFHEKVAHPPGNLANAAIYIVEPEVAHFAASLGHGEVDFSTEVIPRFLGRIQAWHNPGYHRDIGKVESLLAAQRDFPLRPLPTLEPEAPDAWAQLCTRENGALSINLAQALAVALRLPMAFHDENGDSEAICGWPRLAYMPPNIDLDRVLGLLQNSANIYTDSLFFFESTSQSLRLALLDLGAQRNVFVACATAHDNLNGDIL